MGIDWVEGDPAVLRAWRDSQPEVLHPVMPAGVEVSHVRPTGAFRGGILFRPRQLRGGSVVLHFHGGGFVVGSPHTHRIVAATLCSELGLPVVSAGYRLAPEHTLPDQANDAAAAIAAVRELFGTRIVLAGDSAGALTALWGYEAASNADRQSVIGALLFYGVFGDPPDETGSDPEFVAAGLDRRSISAVYARVDPERWIGRAPKFTPASPNFRLPRRIAVVGAGSDPLLAHSRRFAERRPDLCTLQIADGLPHGFLSVQAPSSATRNAVRSAGNALRSWLQAKRKPYDT